MARIWPFAAALCVAFPSHAQPTTDATPAEPHFVIRYEAGPAWKAGQPMDKQDLREHFFYMRRLHANGTIVLAGPVGANGGLVVLRAPSQAAAETVMTNDPAVKSGVFRGSVASFVPVFGQPALDGNAANRN